MSALGVPLLFLFLFGQSFFSDRSWCMSQRQRHLWKKRNGFLLFQEWWALWFLRFQIRFVFSRRAWSIAMSSLARFGSWCILKWDAEERRAGESVADPYCLHCWPVLLAFTCSTSHLASPYDGLFFKKFKPGKWGIVSALVVSGVLVLFINDLIVPGLPTLAGYFELFLWIRWVSSWVWRHRFRTLVNCLFWFVISINQRKNSPSGITFLLALPLF